MNTEMNNTGIVIKYENGHKATIYSKWTKNGIKYYRYERMQMRFFPISKVEIELRQVPNLA
jgi:hypothetical protein